jgi:hypothetical protein
VTFVQDSKEANKPDTYLGKKFLTSKMETAMPVF